MSLIHNPSIVTNGLIMYYDMNNTLKSFKGGPTTNVLTNTNLDTGWSQGYNTSIIIGDTSVGFPPGVNSQVVSFIDANTDGSGYWYSYGDYAPQADNTTYSVSVWAMTSGANWVIQPYTADNSEANRVWLTAKTVIGNGVWQRLEWPNAFTTGAGWDSDSLSFQFNTIPAGQRCWLCAPQMEPLSYCTPFVEGTRSSTQAIIDLTNKTTITSTSLTYASDNTFSFNGTSDAISLGNVLSRNTSGQSLGMSLWVYPTRTSCYIIGRGQTNANYGQYSLILDVGVVRLSIFNSVAGYHYYTLGTISANTWSHIALSHTFGTGANTLSTINGISGGSWTTGNGSAVSDQGATSLEIGHWYGTPNATSNAYWFAGNITNVALYDRAITINEMQQNFNAHRGRYGL